MQTPERQASPICDYEGSTYRTDFWEGKGREYEDRAERVALRHLLPPRGGRLLDIGAGFGRLASLYAGYQQVILLDYSRSQLAFARQQLGDERFIYVAADIYRLPLAANAVDTTVMVRVLHHIADVPLALRQIAHVTRPGGTLVLEHANKRHLMNILRCSLRPGPNPFDRRPYEFAPLHYDFHPAWIEARLHEAGFMPEMRRSVSNLRSGLLKRIFSTTTLVKMDAMLQVMLAPLALGPSVFVCSHNRKAGKQQIVPLEGLFRCPECGAEPLARAAGAMHCVACQSRWPLEDGIFVFK